MVVAKSNMMRVADARALVRCLGECLELGGDVQTWRVHWFANLAALAGADVVVGGEISGILAGTPRSLGTSDFGWGGGFDPIGWRLGQSEFARRPDYLPSFTNYLAEYSRTGTACLTRRQVFGDGDWYRSAGYVDFFACSSVDHHIQSFAPIGRAPDEHSGCVLYRAAGRRDFNQREQTIVQEAHLAVAGFVGGRLTRYSDDAFSCLTARQREVVRCLLDGDGDKQIASRLGISRLTVNSHLKAIYKRFGVCTRAELAALAARRGIHPLAACRPSS